jgi:hypothetical protein
MFNWNTPFSFGPATGFNMASSLSPRAVDIASGASAALASGASGAAGSAAAGGASGLLGAMGGPLGVGLTLASSIAGGIGERNAAKASMQDAREAFKLRTGAGVAGSRFLQRTDIGGQMRALGDRQIARQAGLYGPEDFQNLLAARMSPEAAKRELYSPIYRGLS